MAKKTKEKTKPQKPPKEPKQKKTKDARYSKRRKGLFFALLATLLIAVSVVGACTVFFQVETVTVTGNSDTASSRSWTLPPWKWGPT